MLKPAPFNVVTDDPTGATWALPEGAITRIGIGHQNTVGTREIALSPDEKYFAVGTRIGLWWYDISSMAPVALWEKECGMNSIVEISPDGKRIAIANWDCITKVLDIQSGECISKINQPKIHHSKGNMTFSPDNCRIFIVNVDNNIEVLDVLSGKRIAQMEQETNDGQTYQISKPRFSPDGQHVASTIKDQTYLWDPMTGSITAMFPGRNFAFSPDSRLMACEKSYRIQNTTSVPFASDVFVWDIGTGERITHFTEHEELVKAIRFSPCGQFLVSSDTSRTLHVWDLKKRGLKDTYVGYDRPFYLQDGTLLATVFSRGTIEVWDVEQHEKLQSYELPVESIGYNWFSKCPKLAIANTLSNRQTLSKKTHTFSTLTEPIIFPRAVKFTDEEELAIRGNIRDIVLWDIKSNQTQTISYTSDFNEDIKSFTFLPDGDILVVDWNHNHNVYKVTKISKSDAILLAEFTPSIHLGNDTFAFSEEQIAFSGNGGIIYLWDLKHSEIPRQFIGHTDHVWTLAFSPDSKKLVSGAGDKTARIWDIETGTEITQLPLEKPFTPMALAFSPCGKVIAGGMLHGLNIWCAEEYRLLRSIPQPEDSKRTFAISFSQSGRYLASGTWWQEGMEKMAVRLWDVSTGENIHTFWGHTTDVEILEFSPNGTILVSGSFDGSTLLWNVKPFIDR